MKKNHVFLCFFPSVLIFFLWIGSLQASSAGDDLNRRLQRWHSIQMNFSQTVKDEKGKTLQATAGKMSIIRPKQFRWETDGKPSQLIVGDGQFLWIYDRDLDQVTQKAFSKSFKNTPALLLTGGNQRLNQDYQVTSSQRGTQQQYTLMPRKENDYFTRIQLLFNGDTLFRMILVDQLGQVTTVQFSNVQMDIRLPSQLFHFSPPSDADVVQQ